jgi:hypothetical protein
VVDNNSADESLQYLRSLKWIRLIERSDARQGEGGYAHAAALDVGLAKCDTGFFVSMHSDTFVIRQGWLSELLNYFDGDPAVACVGSGKLELAGRWRLLLKKATDLRTFGRKLLRRPDPLGLYRYYNRTICCLYRTEVLQREKLSFGMDRDKGLTSGQKLYFELLDRGYKTIELLSAVMSRYVVHLGHATQVVNPAEFSLRKKTIKKCNRLVERLMSLEIVTGILKDDSLDK